MKKGLIDYLVYNRITILIIIVVSLVILTVVLSSFSVSSQPVDDFSFKVVVVDCEVDFFDSELLNVGGIYFFHGVNLDFLLNGICVYPVFSDCFLDSSDFLGVGVLFYGFYFEGFSNNICVLNMVFEV